MYPYLESSFEVLMRNFDLDLSTSELESVLMLMDTDKDGRWRLLLAEMQPTLNKNKKCHSAHLFTP